jgi:hypothetical protein
MCPFIAATHTRKLKFHLGGLLQSYTTRLVVATPQEVIDSKIIEQLVAVLVKSGYYFHPKELRKSTKLLSE